MNIMVTLLELEERIAVLTAERDEAVKMLVDWCVAIEENGSSWDDWDEYYKDANYRPTKTNLRQLIDEKKKVIV